MNLNLNLTLIDLELVLINCFDKDDVIFSVRYLSNQLSGNGEFSDWFAAPSGQYSYTLSSLLPATKYFLEAKFVATSQIKELELILELIWN